MATTHFTQPAYCAYARDSFPTLPRPIKQYIEVPLYQESIPHVDTALALKSCCESAVWLYSDPEPCTAVCNFRSKKQALRISYCLNAQQVAYGADMSGATVPRVSLRSVWVVALVGALILSGVLV